VPIFRGSTSRGAHVRAIAETLVAMIDFIDMPSPRRVALRNTLAALKRAYPELNEVIELEHLTEDVEDGL